MCTASFSGKIVVIFDSDSVFMWLTVNTDYFCICGGSYCAERVFCDSGADFFVQCAFIDELQACEG
jgi:hypothetical protein